MHKLIAIAITGNERRNNQLDIRSHRLPLKSKVVMQKSKQFEERYMI